MARTLLELRNQARCGNAIRRRQIGILRDHALRAEDPVTGFIPHLQILAVVLEVIDGRKVAAYLIEAACGTFMAEQFNCTSSTRSCKFMIFGCIYAAFSIHKLARLSRRRGRGEHGEVPERQPNSDRQ